MTNERMIVFYDCRKKLPDFINIWAGYLAAVWLGYDWTSMGRIRVPADRADLVGCLPQRRFGPPWRPPWLTLVTAHSRRREQAFYNFTSPILQFRID